MPMLRAPSPCPSRPHAPPLFTKTCSSFASGQLCLPQFCQSRQIKHVRWHMEEKAFWFIMDLFMDKSYFSWPATCSRGLITFQGTAAIYSNSLGPQMFACTCLPMCVHVWIQLEICSKAVDCKVRMKVKRRLPPFLTSNDCKCHCGYLSWKNDLRSHCNEKNL